MKCSTPPPGSDVTLRLPATYIFLAIGAPHTEWPVMSRSSFTSTTLGAILLHQRFSVVEIIGEWAHVVLDSGLEGWSLMVKDSQWYLVPYKEMLHGELQQLPVLESFPPLRKRSRTLELFQMIFGSKKTGSHKRRLTEQTPELAQSEPSTPERRGSPSPQLIPVQRSHSEHRRSLASLSAAIFPKVYEWQQHRGMYDRQEYLTKLEARRIKLRKMNLAKHTDLLKEWIELVKELDVVLRYKFTTRIVHQSDTSRIRSGSFFNMVVKARTNSDPPTLKTKAVNATPVRRGRSRSLNGDSLKMTIKAFTIDSAFTLDMDTIPRSKSLALDRASKCKTAVNSDSSEFWMGPAHVLVSG